jgi:Flp pilus assembly protein TadD
MRRIVVLILVVCALAACTRASKETSVSERAERLNASKTLARDLVDAGQHRDAIPVLESLSEEASGDYQVFVMLGDSYRALDRPEDALRAYEEAVRVDYYQYETHLKLANLLMEQGKSGRALTEFELAAQYGKGVAVTHYDYGLALYQMDRRKQALDEWRAAYELDSTNPEYAEAMGIGLTDTDAAKAVEYFEAAAELGAEGSSFHNNFGLALQTLGDDQRARSRFERAVKIEPDNEKYRFTLAAAYTNTGAYSEAVAEWDSLVQRFGRRWSYTIYRGRALLALGRFGEAIESVAALVSEFESGGLRQGDERFDRTPPRFSDALEVLAMSHRGDGNEPRALEYIRRAVELDPENVSLRNNYGVILAENGKIAEAKDQWNRVLEIDGNNATARRNLSALER